MSINRTRSSINVFYVQAKGTEHFSDTWGVSIKKRTIGHWLLQMFPVFLIVYDEETGNCYWASIEDRRYSLIGKISQKNSETIRIKMDKSHYNHFAWFGEINRVLGNRELAKRNFEEALRICKRDKNWPRESMKKIIAFIDRQIESCK